VKNLKHTLPRLVGFGTTLSERGLGPFIPNQEQICPLCTALTIAV
jgi:hypothetical protein